jgi:hypothetical protein
MFAVPFAMGNVTVSFAVLSYAGTLAIAILSDPARGPAPRAQRVLTPHQVSG